MTAGQMLHEREVRKFVIACPEGNKTGVENQLHQETKPENAGENETTACPGHARNHTMSATVWPISCLTVTRETRSSDSFYCGCVGSRPSGSEGDCQPVDPELSTRLACRPGELGLDANG